MVEADLRSQIASAVREATGMGLHDVFAVMRDAEENFQGDYVLAALVRHAQGFAISIKSKDPSITAQQARRSWNISWAQNDLANGLRPGWEELSRLNTQSATFRN